jgi:hypothetical protein
VPFDCVSDGLCDVADWLSLAKFLQNRVVHDELQVVRLLFDIYQPQTRRWIYTRVSRQPVHPHLLPDSTERGGFGDALLCPKVLQFESQLLSAVYVQSLQVSRAPRSDSRSIPFVEQPQKRIFGGDPRNVQQLLIHVCVRISDSVQHRFQIGSVFEL